MHQLRGVGQTAAAVMILAGAVPSVAAAAEWGINGTFIATSNGDWAKTNDSFRNEASVRSTWTTTTACVNPGDCTGTVTSDQGWTAPIYAKSGMWYVKRSIPRWQPCPDGSAADGLQMFRFYPVDPQTGQQSPTGSDTYAGEDITTSASGACGINKQLVIRMPFKLVRA